MYNVIKLGATMGSAMVFFTVLIDNSKMLFTFGQLSSYRMKKQHKNVNICFYFIGKFLKEPSSCTKSDWVKNSVPNYHFRLILCNSVWQSNTPGVMESLSNI